MRHSLRSASFSFNGGPGLRLLAAVALLLLAAPVHAEDRAAARQAFSEGSRYYDLNQYSEALDAFKRAYWNYEDPVILYNIAQCHRALKHKGEAIEFYRSYLRKAPNARNHDEVVHVIAETEQALAAEKALSALAPQGTISKLPTPAAPAATPDSALSTSPTAAPSASVLVAPAPLPQPPPPKKRRWVVPVTVVAAVVVVGLGVGLGVGLSSSTSYPSTGGSLVWK